MGQYVINAAMLWIYPLSQLELQSRRVHAQQILDAHRIPNMALAVNNAIVIFQILERLFQRIQNGWMVRNAQHVVWQDLRPILWQADVMTSLMLLQYKLTLVPNTQIVQIAF